MRKLLLRKPRGEHCRRPSQVAVRKQQGRQEAHGVRQGYVGAAALWPCLAPLSQACQLVCQLLCCRQERLQEGGGQVLKGGGLELQQPQLVHVLSFSKTKE